MFLRLTNQVVRGGGEPKLDIAAIPEGPVWHLDALCRQTDPESFFPDKGGSSRAAKSVCQRCPVRAKCLAWALEHQERFGIWGGMSERERRRVLAERRAAS